MISINEALKIIKDNVPAREIETISTGLSLGYMLAEDVLAPEPAPRFDNSAMDGFAVKWDDVRAAAGGGNVKLKIIGESRAGVPFSGTINNGETIRISTGAVVPTGVDTVVPIEDIELSDSTILIKSVARKYQHVRFRAEEINIGDVLINKDTIVNPANIALLTSMDIRKVSVYKKPDVSILVTGTELATSETELGEGRIRDSNGIMLESAVKISGGNVTYFGVAADDPDGLKDRMAEAMNKSKIILISGGVSVGPHDHVKQVSEELGFRRLFWRINQKPGKPLYFARHEDKILFGLPGNPVSALNCYAFYVHPIIRELAGTGFSWQTVNGKLTIPLSAGGGRSVFVRSVIENIDNEVIIAPLARQGSHMLTSISDANGFVIIQPGCDYQSGDIIEAYYYPWEK